MKPENVSSLLVLQVASGEFLALSQDQFEEARALGRRITAAARVAANDEPDQRLLTAEEMEARTSIPATWFLEQARQNAIPHVRFGKYVRFNFSEVCAACERVRVSNVQASGGTSPK
jgi:hypothetical protein